MNLSSYISRQFSSLGYNWAKALGCIRIQLIICGCLLLLFSCSRESSSDRRQAIQEWMNDNGKIKVLSTIAMIDDLVRQVGGEYIDPITLIQGESDPHSYQLVKGDDEKFLRADVIFYNGLDLEHGASLQGFLQKNSKAIPLSYKVQQKEPERILIDHGHVDPHLWMDISLWAEMVPFIVEGLSQKDPNHAAYFVERGDALQKKMLQAHQDIKSTMSEIPQDIRYLVTSHDAFNYFARAYLATAEEVKSGDWHQRFVAPEGLAPESQLSVRDLQLIIDHLKKYQIHVLFPETNVSKDSIRKIIEAGSHSGLNLRISKDALYGDAMGPVGSDGGTYLKMMLYNAHTIAHNLSETKVENE